MSSEMEKMLAGELYDASDPELRAVRHRARELTREYNAAHDRDREWRTGVLRELLGEVGEGVRIVSPFFCDYGRNIRLGDRVFFNFNCAILDCAQVVVGSDTMLGPAVQIYTATHPIDFLARRAGLESAKPITIGSDVWVGGGAIILPGVTIGARSVIGAGSVVTRDVPEGVFAAGNPCRVIRTLHEGDASA